MDDSWYDPMFDLDSDGVLDEVEMDGIIQTMEYEDHMMGMEEEEWHRPRADEIFYNPPPPSSGAEIADVVRWCLVLVALAWIFKSCFEAI